MRFRTLFILCLNFCLISVAGANPFASCPAAFEKMFPAEIGAAVREMPELAFLDPKIVQRVHRADFLLGQKPAKLDILEIPVLKAAVDELQNERRIRFKKLDELRSRRRAERAKSLRVGEAESVRKEHRRRKDAIDEEIRSLRGELDALASHLVPMRNQLGRFVIETAASLTAKKTDTLILLRNTLINAAGQLAHKGVGKGLSAKFHSASEGVIAGLIPYQQRLSSKVSQKGAAEVARMQKLVDEAIEEGSVIKVPFRVGTLVAVERGGQVKFVDIALEHVDDEEIVELIAIFDENWRTRLLVSDVDALAFGRRAELLPEVPVESPSRGIITPTEREVIREYNAQASKLLGREKGTFMAHGAENRNPNSSGVTGYPITAHFPNGKMVVIQAGPDSDPDLHLKAFYLEAAREGFHLEPNPLWGWPDELSALTSHGNAEN